MSVELPEARILALQLEKTIKGKQIKSWDLKDYEKIHKIGFLNKNLNDFDRINGKNVLDAISSGNTILIKLSENLNLLISPEYGGLVFFHKLGSQVPKYHLKICFVDGDFLTVRLTSMGMIYVASESELPNVYLFKRDFMGALTPGSPELSLEKFSELIKTKSTQLKPIFVGKDAIVVGISNSAFQDILFRAKVHPKRKSSELTDDEIHSLYVSMNNLIKERFSLGGKDEWINLYGKHGMYKPAMSSKLKGLPCPQCGYEIQSIALGGGQVNFCPNCQK